MTRPRIADTRATLPKGCQTPGCTKGDHAIVFTPMCHKGSPVVVTYFIEQGELELACARCKKHVVTIAVAEGVPDVA